MLELGEYGDGGVAVEKPRSIIDPKNIPHFLVENLEAILIESET